MAQEKDTPLDKAPKKSRKKRIILWTLAAILIIVILVPLGLIIFLRTESGMGWIKEKLDTALASSGLSLNYEKISGPLPSHLELTGVTLSDSEGVFLTCRSLLLDLSPSKLIFLHLYIDELKVEGADFIRPPKLPEREKSEETEKDISLPVSITAKIEINDSKILSGAGEALQKSIASLNATLNYDKDTKNLSWNLSGSWVNAIGKGITLVSSHDPLGDPENPLVIQLTAQVDSDSPLSILDDTLPYESPTLTINGKGPILDWKGDFTLTVLGLKEPYEKPLLESEDPLDPKLVGPREAARPQNAQGKLSFKGKQNLGLREFLTDPDANFSLELQVRVDPNFPLPYGPAELIGDNLFVKALLHKEKGAIVGQGVVQSNDIYFTLDPLSLTLGPQDFSFDSQGILALLNPQKIVDYLRPPSSPEGEPETTQAANEEAPSGAPLPGQGEASNKRQLPQTAPLSPKANKKKAPRPENLVGNGDMAPLAPVTASYSIKTTNKDHAVVVEDFQLKGDGIDLALSFDYTKQTKLLKSIVALTLEGKSHYSRFLTALAPLPGPSVGIVLKVDGSYEISTGAVDGLELNLDLDDLAQVYGHLKGGAELSVSLSGNVKGKLDATISTQASQIDIVSNISDPLPLVVLDPTLKLKVEADNLFEAPSVKADMDFSGESLQKEDGRKEDSSIKGTLAYNYLGQGTHNITASDFALGALGHLISTPALSVLFAPDDELPLLNGQLKVKISDTTVESKLTGGNFSSSPITADFNFTHGETALYQAQVECASFTMGERLSLKDTSLKLSITNPHTTASYNVELLEGPGKYSSFAWQKGKLTITNPVAGGPVGVNAEFTNPNGKDLIFVNGTYNAPDALVKLESLRLTPPGLDTITLTRPVSLKESSSSGHTVLSLDTLTLALGRASLRVTGDLSPVNLALELDNLPLSLFQSLGLESMPDGEVNLSVKYAQGGTGSFDLKAGVDLNDSSSQKLHFNISGNGLLSEAKHLKGVFTVLLPGPRAQEEPITLNYELPMLPQGDFVSLDMHGPIQLDLDWLGNSQSIFYLLGLSDHNLTGNMEVDVSVRGSLNNFIPKADIYLANGLYEDQVLGISLNKINLALDLDEGVETAKILMEASDGSSGTIALEGMIAPFTSPPTVNARAQVRHLAPLHRDDLNLIISGLMSITGDLRSPKISARTMIETAELNISGSFGGPSIKTLTISTETVEKRPGPDLDLEIDIPKSAFVRGRGLDSEWMGNIKILGNTSSPTISGYLKPVRGYFTFLGKDFSFTGGEITFRNLKKLNPGLDIELTHSVPNLTAIMKIQGTLNTPRISFQSTPPYPEDEVLSQVLFSKKASELSRLEAIQLANNIRELAGVGSNMPNPLVTMREALGLSVLRVGEASGSNDRLLSGNSFRDNLDLDGNNENEEESTSPTIEAGKYISDKIYVGVEQNLVDNTTGVKVEVELTPSLNLVGRSSTASSRLALGWKHDY
ncbi:MAG: translocation/assembly module TamB [Deltaproteobacteria bacterium]|jgi:translocation and assembly module TamB|nr:translocation/assembly module TamB [Deltaproteobacteria bacterium]